MITKTKSYTTSDKRAFSTVDEAKQHELEVRLIPGLCNDGSDTSKHIAASIAEAIATMVKEPATFIAILKASEPKKRAPKRPKAPAKPAAKAA